MNKLPLIFTAAALLTQPLLAEDAKLIQATASAGLPEGVDYQVKPMGYEYGVKLTFFIEGANFIEIDDKSLVADGWKLGSFPRVNKEGTQATFSVFKKGNFVSKVDTVRVAGSVTMKTGSDPVTKTVAVTKDKEAVLGAYKLQLKLDGSKWSQGVKVTGDLSNIKSIKVEQGGKEVKRSGWSGSSNSRTYNFKGIKDGALVSLEYWTKSGKKTIKFSK